MKNLKIGNFIYILVVISLISWYLLALYEDLNLNQLQDAFILVPQVVTVNMMFAGAFIKWGWKFKWLRGWLVPYPNLNGTWTGYIYSDWKHPETENDKVIDPIPVMLTINQSFAHINCRMFTAEMKSESMSEGFTIDSEKQIKQLSYIFTSKPRAALSERSNQHVGAVLVDIIGKKEQKLNGHYWTNRKTKGEINLVFYSKELLNELPSDMEEHPVTEESYMRDWL